MNQTSIHWSNYWKQGQLTSLPQDFKLNYNGNILKEWIKSFKLLAKNSRVLDLCAGNCAISLLTAEYSNSYSLNLDIYAVDAAQINKQSIIQKNPSQSKYLSKIHLFPNCPVENIEFESNQFDLITSQYGIEYCQWDVSAQQIYRLLKNGGEFTMISHSGSTKIIKYMNIEKNNYQYLFQIGLFRYLEQYSKKKISFRVLLQNLYRIQVKLSQYYHQNPSELIKSILVLNNDILNANKETLSSKRQDILNLCKQHKYAYQRLNDLFSVTKSITDHPHWYKVFSEKGLELVESRILTQNNSDQSGTLYRFKKSNN